AGSGPFTQVVNPPNPVEPEPEDDDDDEENCPTPTNRAPVVMGPVRLNDVFAGQVVLIGLVHLLRGASDPDSDPLGVDALTISGAELVATDSGWLLKTSPGMVGPIVISYRVSDGQAWVAQTANLDIVRKQYQGSPDDDIIIGSPYDDDID